MTGEIRSFYRKCADSRHERKGGRKMKKIFEEIGESGFRLMIIIALGALALYLIGTDGNSTVGQAFSALVQKITNWAM